MWLVKLSGYDTPEAVRDLRNYTLLIREDERDPDDELEDDDEFYVQVLLERQQPCLQWSPRNWWAWR